MKRAVLGELCDFFNGGAWSDKEYVNAGIPGAESAGFRHDNRNGFGHNIQVLCKRFDRITLVYYTIYDMECGIL